jgi:hypothetical protein
MGTYAQLSIEEWCAIARLHESGQSIRKIAGALDRQPLTVSRELKRNAGVKIDYQPGPAEQQSDPEPVIAIARVARAWAMVHGYAVPLLDGRLEPLLDGNSRRSMRRCCSGLCWSLSSGRVAKSGPTEAFCRR